MKMSLARIGTSVTGTLLAALLAAPVMAQPTGGFIAVLDDDKNNSDSSKSVVFYDADDMSSPMFAVFMGWKDSNTQLVIGNPVTTGDSRSVQSMAIDPVTGDTYILAIDRDAPQGTVYTPDADDINFGSLSPNTEGDYDLLKVNFQFAYNDWVNNQGSAYVTYINTPGQTYNDNASNPNANEVDLPGVLDKIGEISKPAFNDFAPNGGSSYVDSQLSFVDDSTLVVLDRVNNLVTTQADIDTAPQANDAQVRVISRVSTSPGLATNPAAPGGDGGFNLGTSESWESTVVGSPFMDSVGLGEYVSTALVNDAATGTLGLWIAENDQPAAPGDSISFFEITNQTGTAGNGLKEFNVGGGPVFPTAFILDDNPVLDSSSNDGDANGIHVNPLTGDLFIIESGFFDAVQDEPSVIIREVTSYDNGLGQIEFGAWSYLQLDLTAVADDDTFITEGRRTAYDYVNNNMYFYDFDNSGVGGGGNFLFDWYVLDLDTGVVTAANIDADDSTRGFGFEDRYEFFCLGASCGSTPLEGDLDGDGFVGINDLNLVLSNWNLNVPPGDPLADPSGDGFVGIEDLNTVLGNWNAGTPPAAGAAVPEPASLALLTIGGLTALGRRRNRA
jgi:PEP-CTERM motif